MTQIMRLMTTSMTPSFVGGLDSLKEVWVESNDTFPFLCSFLATTENVEIKGQFSLFLFAFCSWQGTPLSESPSSWAYLSIWGFSTLFKGPRQCSEGVLAPLLHTLQKPRTLHLSTQSHTD